MKRRRRTSRQQLSSSRSRYACLALGPKSPQVAKPCSRAAVTSLGASTGTAPGLQLEGEVRVRLGLVTVCSWKGGLEEVIATATGPDCDTRDLLAQSATSAIDALLAPSRGTTDLGKVAAHHDQTPSKSLDGSLVVEVHVPRPGITPEFAQTLVQCVNRAFTTRLAGRGV
jgi:hypothetical protein